jgi:hypothetical protein
MERWQDTELSGGRIQNGAVAGYRMTHHESDEDIGEKLE